jgi:hypothetical protein
MLSPAPDKEPAVTLRRRLRLRFAFIAHLLLMRQQILITPMRLAGRHAIVFIDDVITPILRH